MIAGPSGVGKSTLVARLRKHRPDLWWSVSATTRPPRRGEVAEVDYLFCSEKDFDDLVARGQLLEWVEVYGHRSGTPRAPLAHALAEGRDVLLELDVEGARSVKLEIPETVTIFLSPPSLAVLRERLSERRTEDPEKAARRLARAEEEMGASAEFDHVVVNDDLERALEEIAGIISRSISDKGRAS